MHQRPTDDYWIRGDRPPADYMGAFEEREEDGRRQKVRDILTRPVFTSPVFKGPMFKGAAVAVVVLAFGYCVRSGDQTERAVQDCTTVALAMYATELRISIERLEPRVLEDIVFNLRRKCSDPAYRAWLTDEIAR